MSSVAQPSLWTDPLRGPSAPCGPRGRPGDSASRCPPPAPARRLTPTARAPQQQVGESQNQPTNPRAGAEQKPGVVRLAGVASESSGQRAGRRHKKPAVGRGARRSALALQHLRWRTRPGRETRPSTSAGSDSNTSTRPEEPGRSPALRRVTAKRTSRQIVDDPPRTCAFRRPESLAAGLAGALTVSWGRSVPAPGPTCPQASPAP